MDNRARQCEVLRERPRTRQLGRSSIPLAKGVALPSMGPISAVQSA